MNYNAAPSRIKACALIPIYNHPKALAATVAIAIQQGLDVILVDDGSAADCAQIIDRLATQAPVSLVRHSYNRGKGAAVKSGLAEAAKRGYSHALQIDADGQHDLTAIARFLAAAEQAPSSLISGVPRFDSSVPRHRFYGRYLTHICVWLNTLSLTITDSMCGFRFYPVAEAHRLCAQVRGERMDFDTEFIVRWVWAARPLKELSVAVHYPEQGVSHFNLWRDNRLIAQMHIRLLFGMLWRCPRLLARKFRRNSGAGHYD